MAAVTRETTLDSHAYDTIKGSDFLADQDSVDRIFRKEAPPVNLTSFRTMGMPIQQRP